MRRKDQKRIKNVPKNNGTKIRDLQDTPEYDEMPIIFSLERIQCGKHCFCKLDRKEKADFANSIYKRKKITWNEVREIDRHSLGTEKIPIKKIRPKMPAFITDDMKDLIVMRYHKRKPMIGYRQKNIFYVLWFDHDFSVYPH